MSKTILGKNLAPFSALSSTHGTIAGLCDALEAVADSLPGNIDRRSCQCLAETLVPLLKLAQQQEERQVFPVLRVRGGAAETFERLLYEHFEDLCFAEEASEALSGLASENDVNTEAVGYLLRGLFTMLRRHIAFERQFLESQSATE
ncbi:hemerythrin domain-containing protein [Martelella soudanensis]|uniref:hemerythrin domain-containing protein n=1 Tax=unclassified Martelella TaxID=2629616 RepID=UPI0015DED57E|nr:MULTISPECIES: hemerythrin domain-containing protein [unclassified Martelella]